MRGMRQLLYSNRDTFVENYSVIRDFTEMRHVGVLVTGFTKTGQYL